MNNTMNLRPGFNPLTLILMVIGFMLFWPLGLAMLAFMLWGDRIPELRRNMTEGRTGFRSGNCWGAASTRAPSGNAAFDEYRAAELRRLDEERHRLEAERQEFEAYAQNLRRARDQEEFNRFMGERGNRTV